MLLVESRELSALRRFASDVAIAYRPWKTVGGLMIIVAVRLLKRLLEQNYQSTL